ncbi:MAG: zinc-binding dehydrogenase [Bifidobacteriaceae bacterium]|jgi:NADPH:quinone reductase-like Zn-dependent oxidoreductase|nr:zinc-binding dehydrogenase [Bifidobacteriaceae bacterium]
MKAIYASGINYDDPLSVLSVGELPDVPVRPNWASIDVRAVTVNHHDLWSLQGVGLSEKQTPMILGTDAAGILREDIGTGRTAMHAGDEVVLYTLVGGHGGDSAGVGPDERRTILSEKYSGTMGQQASVPAANVFRKPANLSMTEAAALGTSWLTAYSMLFSAARVLPGDSVLVQGAGGGVATAAIQLAHAAGLEVFVTSRSEEKRDRALALGADVAVEAGARLPKKVDAVIESVGSATWSHSVKSVRPGGTIAICGATSGDQPGAELTRIFFQDLRVQGVTMGSRDDFARLLHFVEHSDLHPVIAEKFTWDTSAEDSTAAAPVHDAFATVLTGDQFGKVVIEVA